MADYSNIQKEETLKAQVFRDFFSSQKYTYEPDIDNIDFVVTEAKTQKGNLWANHYLWAEAKKGIQEISVMITQLILTIKKTIDKGERLPPPYIGCFDTQRIAFIPFHDILPIFNESDFNWNTPPSNHEAKDFKKAKSKIEKLYLSNLVLFHFASDKDDII